MIQKTLNNNQGKRCAYCGRKATTQMMDAFRGYIQLCSDCKNRIKKTNY